jgi:transcriptional regulator with XRE-family HTH domain
MVETIRRAVAECGLSLNELGRQTGVNQGQLSRFMRGERTLTLPAAARVCAALGLRLTPAPTSGRRGKTS